MSKTIALSMYRISSNKHLMGATYSKIDKKYKGSLKNIKDLKRKIPKNKDMFKY